MNIDLTLEINCHATAALHLLKNFYDSSFDDTFTSTRAWYNGRERGYSLEIRLHFYKKGSTLQSLFVVFAEDRNTDRLFVDHWLGVPTMNGPTPSDPGYEIGYQRRKTLDSVEACTQFINELVKEYVSENKDSNFSTKNNG